MKLRSQRNPKYSCFGSWLVPSAIAIAGIATTAAIVVPARAAIVNAWNFDVASQQFSVTLPDDVTPDYFLLAEPARIVLDLPGTALGSVSATEQYDDAVRTIRLLEIQDGTRVVLELAPNTRLDPRHAELTATDVGNGQTQWTLRPLLQDSAPSNVATAPAAPPEPSPTSIEVEPELPQVTVAPDPEADGIDRVPADDDLDQVTDESEAITAEAAEDGELLAPLPDGLTDEALPEAIAVPPGPDFIEPAVELPVEPSLPDIANAATVGAAQALPLPTGPDWATGVSTDASDLAGVERGNLVDLPPNQIPIDPFAGNAPAVSVPSLAEADSTPAPVVSVPPVATLPDEVPPPQAAPPSAVPAAPDSVPPSGSDAIAVAPPAAPPAPSSAAPTPPAPTMAPNAGPVAPNQVRPPDADAIAVAPPTPPPTPELVPSAPTNDVVAANSLEIPTMPLPPESWRNATANLPANQVRPPTVAIAPPVNDASQVRPPTATSTPATATVAPPANGANQIRPPSVAVAPPANSANQVRPPTAAAVPPVNSANQVRPPTAAIAQSPTVPEPVSPLTTANQVQPPTATIARAESEPSSPSNLAAVPEIGSLPPALPTVTPPAPPTTLADPPPPFLTSDGVTPPDDEPLSIPPPPTTVPTPATVPFGMPLPQTHSDGGAEPVAEMPVGTRLPLQYVGATPLALETSAPIQEVLVVADDVYHPDTGRVIVPSGTQVVGRFEDFDDSGRRFVAETVIDSNRQVPLLVASDSIVGSLPLDSGDVAWGSRIGSAAATIVTGFSGIGLIGGAAIGAADMNTAPTLVSLAPGEVIEVEVVPENSPL
ncbi:MAG: AMIN domain-containing protein [Cyanobacteria bacterium P01_H01_bin.162]